MPLSPAACRMDRANSEGGLKWRSPSLAPWTKEKHRPPCRHQHRFLKRASGCSCETAKTHLAVPMPGIEPRHRDMPSVNPLSVEAGLFVIAARGTRRWGIIDEFRFVSCISLDLHRIREAKPPYLRCRRKAECQAAEPVWSSVPPQQLPPLLGNSVPLLSSNDVRIGTSCRRTRRPFSLALRRFSRFTCIRIRCIVSSLCRARIVRAALQFLASSASTSRRCEM